MKNNLTSILEKAADRDAYISQKLRERRLYLKLKQRDLADKIGVSIQQIHKYEKGIDRITAGRLYEIAKILSVPLDFFYQDANNPTPLASPHELVVTCKDQMGKKIKIELLNLDIILSDT